MWSSLRAWGVAMALVGTAAAPAFAQETPPAALAAPASADDLFAAFATMPGLEARFVEEKHIGLLAAPLRSEGTLYFMPPGTLARRVERPSPSQVLITPEAVHFSDGGGAQTIPLASRPELRALIESMVWLLAGDATSLRAAYAVGYETDGDRWTVTLTPSHAPLTELIAEMRIVGAGLTVSEVTVTETTGDETVTRIVDADPAREFDADEREALFSTPTQ